MHSFVYVFMLVADIGFSMLVFDLGLFSSLMFIVNNTQIKPWSDSALHSLKVSRKQH